MQLSLESGNYSFERFNKIQREMLTQIIAQVIEQEGGMRAGEEIEGPFPGTEKRHSPLQGR